MNGFIDNSGRAMLPVTLRAAFEDQPTSMNAWVDTGFTGDLVLPQKMVESLQLPKSGSTDAILADGSLVEVSLFRCVLDWFGFQRIVEVIENDGDRALLGVGLLLGCELRANYHSMQLALRLA